MTPQLRTVIEEAYRVFGGYTIRHSLTVCHCNSCMTPDDELRLLKTPLREIPAKLLAEYTGSAHDWNEGPVAREMRYFLPRYFELIASNDPPDWGIDICLRRLGQAGWRSKWPKLEEDIIDRFFDELLVSSLQRLELAHWPAGWRLGFDIVDVLTLVVTAAGDIDRVLAKWEAAEDPPAAIHMAALRASVVRETTRTFLHSAYLEDHKEAADKIGAFLMRPEVVSRIEAAFFRVEDARLQKLISDAIYPG
jgi:hypothetical protein